MIRQLPDLGTGVAAFFLLAVITLSPLPFGSVLPRERLVLEMAGFVALSLLLLSRRDTALFRPALIPALAIAGVGVFGILQSLSVPAFLAAALVPSGAEAWRSAAALLGEERAFLPLSMSPAVSRSVALLWLGAAAMLIAACGMSADRRLRRFWALGFLAVAVFEISYGAERWFARSSEIWNRSLPGGFDRLRGTFVNPDHFAMFLILALAACFAWVWWSMRRAFSRGGLFERRLLYVVLPWFFFVMLFAGLAFTGSRAGLVGGLGGLFAQGLLLAVSERRWRASFMGLTALGVGLLSLFYFGWQQGMGRWLATSAYELTWNARFVVYRASFELWQLFPFTGTGLGTFRQAFPLVQPAELDLSWFHAHSDILELGVTTGLVGPALLAWGLFVLCRRLWHNLRYGRRSEDRAMVLAAWGVLVGVVIHSAIDFGLTLPANAFLTVIVLGLALGVRTFVPQAPSA